MANTTVNIDIQVQSKSLNELEQELADINAELKEVPVNSQAFKDLSQEAQGLTKELTKAQEAAEGFTSEEKFRAADGAIKLMGGSLASVVGTLGVLGVESEAFGEFEEKAASAIAVAIGFKDVGEGITQLGPLLGKAGSAVKGFSITTKQALIATGIGAFVVVLGTVIAYWDDITAGVKKFGEAVPFVGKAIEVVKDGIDALVDAFRPVLEFLGIIPDEVEKANQAMIESNNQLIESHEREIAILEASGATAEEIYNKKMELLNAELDNLKRTGADKEEIYKKETEILTTQAKEQKRISDQKAKEDLERTTKLKEDQKKAEEKYQSVYKTIQDLQVSLAQQTAQQILDIQKAQIEASIQALQVSDEKKKELLDTYNQYYAAKSEELKLIDKKQLLERELDQKEFFSNLQTQTIDSFTNLFDLTRTGYDERIDLIRGQAAVETTLREEEYNAQLAQVKAFYIEEIGAAGENAARKIELRQQQAEAEKLVLQTFENDKQAIQAFYNAQEILLDQEKNQVKLAVAMQAAQGFAQLLNVIGEENKAAAIAAIVIEKAAAVAQIISNTAIANAKLVAAFPVTLGQPWVGINTAGAAASIAATVLAGGKAIGQINSGTPSLGGGSSASGLQNNTAPSAPAQTPNIESRAPQSLNASPVTKTYVLTGDVTSGMEAEAKLNTKRTIG